MTEEQQKRLFYLNNLIIKNMKILSRATADFNEAIQYLYFHLQEIENSKTEEQDVVNNPIRGH